jgi:hypothetical protein
VTALRLAIVMASALAAAPNASAQTAPPNAPAQTAPAPGEPIAQHIDSTAEIGRVRAALAKPPSKLTLQEVVPDFSVHIEKRRPMQDIFDIPPWQLPPHGWQPPAIGFDLMSLVRYVSKGVSDAKRGRDERLASEEVERALADYCAGQPDSTAGIQMCSTLPAVR